MKGAKAAPKSVKSAKGTITKGKAAGGGAAAREAASKKKADAKTMKEDLKERIQEDDVMMDLLEEMGDVEFDEEELLQLICSVVENDCGDDEVVKFLVEKGLELDGRHCDGDESPLAWAVAYSKFNAVEALLRAGAEPYEMVFRHALCNKPGNMVKLLIKYDADVNIDLDMDGTVLHYAAVKAVFLDDLTCLRLFLEAGAKERCVEVEGRTFTEALTPTQYIQRDLGEDGDKVGAVERAVDLLYEYSSAGKRAAKQESKINELSSVLNELSSALGELVSVVAQISNRLGGGAAGGGVGGGVVQPGIVPANNMPGFMPGFMPGVPGMPGYIPGMPFQGGVQGFPGFPGVAPPGVAPQGQARGESKKESGSGAAK